MLPSTTDGTAVSSFEPLPKESSPDPVGLSALVRTPDRMAEPDPPDSQSMAGAPPLTTRLALVSTSKFPPIPLAAWTPTTAHPPMASRVAAVTPRAIMRRRGPFRTSALSALGVMDPPRDGRPL